MSSELKLRRGSSAAHSTFTGADGEVTFNTDTNALVSHDGATAGGFPHVKAGDLAAPSGASLVGYMPAGVGTASGTVADTLNANVIATSFTGVDRTGASNSAVGMQAAINHCILYNKVLLIPAGTYLMANTTLTISGPIVIRGESEQTTFLKTVKADLSPPNGTGTGYKHLFDVKNTLSYGDVIFENLTMDGGNSAMTKPFRSTHKCINAWRYGNEPVIVPLRKIGVYRCTIKNFEGEGASGTGGDGNGGRHLDYAEVLNCTFSRNEGGSVNLSGSCIIRDSHFSDRAGIEIALNRFYGNLTITGCDFYNTARGGSGSTISVLNDTGTFDGSAGAIAARSGTSVIIAKNRFNNTRTYVETYVPSPYVLTSISVYGVGNVSINNNYLRNAGKGSIYGNGPIMLRQYNDVVSIENNVISISDAFFITEIAFPYSASYMSMLSIKNNSAIAEYPVTTLASIYAGGEPLTKPKRFTSIGNTISIPSAITFPAASATVVTLSLPVRRTYRLRATMNIVTSALTTVTPHNSSSAGLATGYSGTPAIGTFSTSFEFTTDNSNASQIISEFLIKASSSVNNTISIELDSI